MSRNPLHTRAFRTTAAILVALCVAAPALAYAYPRGTLLVSHASTEVSPASVARQSTTPAAVFDANGDGQDDLVVGAPGDSEGGVDAGAVFIFFGPLAGGHLNLTDADVKLVGEAGTNSSYPGTYAGWAVAGGDVNGDGLVDVLVGAPGHDGPGAEGGMVYVVFGRTSWNASYLLANAEVKIQGEDLGDEAIWALASAGDVNGDGYDDIVIGAPWTVSPAFHGGSTYLWLGSATIGGAHNIGNAYAEWFGLTTGERVGIGVAGAGDVDGDGIDDFLFGASAGFTSREGYLVFGPPAPGARGADQADVVFTGPIDSARAVAGPGDVNGDGFRDILLGGPAENAPSRSPGAARVFYGGPSLRLATTLAIESAPLQLLGEMNCDRAGWSVTGAGDLDKDGLADFLIGAPGDILARGGCPEEQLSRGQAYVMHGSATLAGAQPLALVRDAKISGLTDGGYAGLAVAAGDLDGNGLSDIVVLERGIDFGQGAVYVFLTR